MKSVLLAFTLLCALTYVAVAQEGPLPNKDTGTVNEMNQSPDQNQVMVGQRPSAGTGGSAGLVPDYSDRVNGSAYPTSNNVSAGPNQGAIAGNPGGMDQHSAAPLPDAEAVKVAARGAAPTYTPEANQTGPATKSITPSPGAKALTRSSNGGQSNESKQSKQAKQKQQSQR